MRKNTPGACGASPRRLKGRRGVLVQASIPADSSTSALLARQEPGPALISGSGQEYACGVRATEAMRSYVGGRRVACEKLDVDRCKRVIGRCFTLPGGLDVAEATLQPPTRTSKTSDPAPRKAPDESPCALEINR